MCDCVEKAIFVSSVNLKSPHNLHRSTKFNFKIELCTEIEHKLNFKIELLYLSLNCVEIMNVKFLGWMHANSDKL